MESKSFLNELKIYREQTFSPSYHNVRVRKLKSNSIKIFSLFGEIQKLTKKLRLEFKKRALISKFYLTEPFKATDNTIYLAIRITGGIGDVVCIARWIKQIKQRFSESIVIDVFFTSPEMTRFILLSVGVRDVLSDIVFRRLSPSYDVYLMVNQFIIPCDFEFKYKHIISIAPGLIPLINNIIDSQVPYQKYIDYHPRLDGLFADLVVGQGLSRKDFLSVISGFERPSPYLPIKLPDCAFPEELGLSEKQYITVHDGWDANFKMEAVRPTKSFPLDLINKAIFLIKKIYPHIKVVQLGGNTGQIIAGVDVNLRGKISLDQSALVLRRAVAHVDSESGLVHLATSLGTPCIVIFGSTNSGYYGYQENYNIKPKECGNCMWVTDTWMESCPLQFKKPKCTQSIMPSDIVDGLDSVLSGKNFDRLDSSLM